MKDPLEILLYVGLPFGMITAAIFEKLPWEFPNELGVPICITFGVLVLLGIGFITWTI